MAIGAFPIFKLGALVLKQVSKPLASYVKSRAKSNPFFRTYICMPPAQFYHWCEVKMRMWTMNLGKPVNIPKLNESMAIDLGAELLGEGVIFVTAAGIMVFEYVRSSRKEAAKEESRVQELARIQTELKELYFAKARQEAQLRELIRVLHVSLPSASLPPSGSYNPEDIPEHHRDDLPPPEDTSMFGTMKGLIWTAIDILLPPVNDSEAIKSKTSPDVPPQLRTTIVTDQNTQKTLVIQTVPSSGSSPKLQMQQSNADTDRLSKCAPGAPVTSIESRGTT